REGPKTSRISPAPSVCCSSSRRSSSKGYPMAEMDQGEIDAFLAEPRLCHFATVDAKGHPRVRPLWFLWKDGEFWFTTRLRRRFTGRDVAGGSAVAVSIASERRPYQAVVAH